MCGIIGYVGNRNTADVLIGGLKKLEYRGYDSAGIALYKDGAIQVYKKKGKVQSLADAVAGPEYRRRTRGIGHTRWATHGEPSDINSHPHRGKNVVLVHNGIIENYLEIKEELAAKGIRPPAIPIRRSPPC